MKQVRLDPLGILARKPGTVEAAARKPEIARMTNTEVGLCPKCGEQMQVCEVDKVQAYVCMEHCVCVPLKDA